MMSYLPQVDISGVYGPKTEEDDPVIERFNQKTISEAMSQTDLTGLYRILYLSASGALHLDIISAGEVEKEISKRIRILCKQKDKEMEAMESAQ